MQHRHIIQPAHAVAVAVAENNHAEQEQQQLSIELEYVEWPRENDVLLFGPRWFVTTLHPGTKRYLAQMELHAEAYGRLSSAREQNKYIGQLIDMLMKKEGVRFLEYQNNVGKWAILEGWIACKEVEIELKKRLNDKDDGSAMKQRSWNPDVHSLLTPVESSSQSKNARPKSSTESSQPTEESDAETVGSDDREIHSGISRLFPEVQTTGISQDQSADSLAHGNNERGETTSSSPKPGSPKPGSPKPGSPKPGSPKPGSTEPGSTEPGSPGRLHSPVDIKTLTATQTPPCASLCSWAQAGKTGQQELVSQLSLISSNYDKIQLRRVSTSSGTETPLDFCPFEARDGALPAAATNTGEIGRRMSEAQHKKNSSLGSKKSVAEQQKDSQDSEHPSPSGGIANAHSAIIASSSLPRNNDERPLLPDGAERHEDDKIQRQMIREEDVLCGVPAISSTHQRGNVQYSALVESRASDFASAATTADQKQIAKQLVTEMKKTGARFLEFEISTGLWHELSEVRIVEKTRTALRRRCTANATSTSHSLSKEVTVTNPSTHDAVCEPEYMNEKSNFFVQLVESHANSHGMASTLEQQNDIIYKKHATHGAWKDIGDKAFSETKNALSLSYFSRCMPTPCASDTDGAKVEEWQNSNQAQQEHRLQTMGDQLNKNEGLLMNSSKVDLSKADGKCHERPTKEGISLSGQQHRPTLSSEKDNSLDGEGGRDGTVLLEERKSVCTSPSDANATIFPESNEGTFATEEIISMQTEGNSKDTEEKDIQQTTPCSSGMYQNNSPSLEQTATVQTRGDVMNGKLCHDKPQLNVGITPKKRDNTSSLECTSVPRKKKFKLLQKADEFSEKDEAIAAAKFQEEYANREHSVFSPKLENASSGQSNATDASVGGPSINAVLSHGTWCELVEILGKGAMANNEHATEFLLNMGKELRKQGKKEPSLAHCTHFLRKTGVTNIYYTTLRDIEFARWVNKWHSYDAVVDQLGDLKLSPGITDGGGNDKLFVSVSVGLNVFSPNFVNVSSSQSNVLDGSTTRHKKLGELPCMEMDEDLNYQSDNSFSFHANTHLFKTVEQREFVISIEGRRRSGVLVSLGSARIGLSDLGQYCNSHTQWVTRKVSLTPSDSFASGFVAIRFRRSHLEEGYIKAKREMVTTSLRHNLNMIENFNKGLEGQKQITASIRGSGNFSLLDAATKVGDPSLIASVQELLSNEGKCSKLEGCMRAASPCDLQQLSINSHSKRPSGRQGQNCPPKKVHTFARRSSTSSTSHHMGAGDPNQSESSQLPILHEAKWMEEGVRCKFFGTPRRCRYAPDCMFLHICPPIRADLLDRCPSASVNSITSHVAYKYGNGMDGKQWVTAAYHEKETKIIFYAQRGAQGVLSSQGIYWYPTKNDALAAVAQAVSCYKKFEHLREF